MTSPISPSSLGAIRIPSINPANSVAASRADQAEEAGDTGFSKVVGDALASVSRMDRAVEAAAEKAAVGDLSSVSDYMIAATEAQLATEITVAVRDRAVTAFNDIMRMQI